MEVRAAAAKCLAAPVRFSLKHVLHRAGENLPGKLAQRGRVIGLKARLPSKPAQVPSLSRPPNSPFAFSGQSVGWTGSPPVTAETKRHSSRCASRVEPRDAIIPPLTKTIRGGIFVCLKTAPHLQIGGNDHV